MFNEFDILNIYSTQHTKQVVPLYKIENNNSLYIFPVVEPYFPLHFL